MYVPYCTSDAYSGRKAASSETGGYAFYGKVKLCHNTWISFCVQHNFKLTLQFKAVVEGLVEDLLEKVTMIIKKHLPEMHKGH